MSARTQRMLEQLNPPQRRAVLTTSGPLLVLAGAGTGKTRVVTYRIARLIAQGVRPERILAVTFTNKAANEMQERVSQLLGKKQEQLPEISTFHALCVRILRRHITRLGYPQRFAIFATGQQEGLARRVLRECKLSDTALKPSELLWQISNWKTHSISPDQSLREAANDKQHLAAIAYRRYQASLKAAGAVDFDDLLLLTEQLFAGEPRVRKQEAARFDHILIDEYQDTNRSQYRIIKTLAVGHRNLCVVGDDDQSIYSWRGAEVRHILGFQEDWPEATVVRLQDNYRSTAPILELANRLIQFNTTRFDKKLLPDRQGGQRPRIQQYPDETVEAEATVEDIRRRLQREEIEPGDVAILFRTNEQPRLFETELRQTNLPYVLIGGMSFFDRKEVRDVLAYLRLIDEPHDDTALLRILNVPARGIGGKTAELLTATAIAEDQPIWKLVRRADQIPGVPPAAVTGMNDLAQLVRQFRDAAKVGSLADTVNQMVREVGYRRELERLYADEEERASRWKSVEEVVSAVADYEARVRQRRGKPKEATLGDFLNEIAISGRETQDEKEKELRRNAIVLMTLHAAKGLEFPHVYLVGMEEEILPHHRSIQVDGEAIDEERRLCYVGVTRAQDSLTLSMALARRKWGKLRPRHASRFLFEMTGQTERAKAKGTSRARKKGATHKTT